MKERGGGNQSWFLLFTLVSKVYLDLHKLEQRVCKKRRWKAILILVFCTFVWCVLGFVQAWAACVQEKEVESVPESTSRVSLQVPRSNVSIKSFFGQFLFSLSLSGLLCHFHLAITQIRFRNQISMRSFWNMGRLCFLLSTKQKIPKKCL